MLSGILHYSVFVFYFIFLLERGGSEDTGDCSIVFFCKGHS